MSNLRVLNHTFLTLSLIVFSLIPALGQATLGRVEGKVVDASGSAIGGAKITIESISETAGFKRTISTDENGRFVIAELPSGTYAISFAATGFSTFSDRTSVSAGGITQLLPELTVASMDDPYMGVRSTSQQFDELPRRTTFSSSLKFAGSVRPEPLVAGFQINGASGGENTFFVDGQEVTNYRTGALNLNNDLPFELLREVQVIPSQREARFSGAFGGVVNVVTPGGGERWRGNFGISFVPSQLQGDPNVVLNRLNSSPGGFEFFQPRKDDGTGFFPTATLSGPIVKNRLWFLASYSPQIHEVQRTIDYYRLGSNPLTISETITYPADFRTEAGFLRFDSQPVSRLRLFGTFLYNPTIQDGALPTNTEGFNGFPQSAGGLRGSAFLAERGGRVNSNIVNGQATWTPIDNLVLNFRAGRGFLNEKLNSYGVPRITRFICAAGSAAGSTPGSNCSSGFQNIANNLVLDRDISIRTTFDADANLFGINALGRHNFRVGYQLNDLYNDVKNGYTDTGIVNLIYGRSISSLTGQNATPGNLGSGFLQRFGTVGVAKSRLQSLYAQDAWRIGPLSLDLGIRFESEVVPNYGSSDTETIEFGWNDKIAPRAGFAFDLTGNGKARVYGGFGWYYDRFKHNLPQDRFGGTFFRRDYFEILPSRGAAYSNYTFDAILGGRADVLGGTCPIVGGPGFSVCQFDFSVPVNSAISGPFTGGAIDPELEPARQTEITVGGETEIVWGVKASGRYSHKHVDKAIETVATFNNQGSEVFLISNPGFGQACVISGTTGSPCPKAERKYDAVEVGLDKMAANFFVTASYTWSRLFGNYSGLASSDEFGRLSPNLTAYFDFPSQGFTADGTANNGRLPTDRPHVFKAFGEYSFDWGRNNNRTDVAAFTTVQSGTPLTTIYSLYGITSSILFGRGDLGRTEHFSETDLRIGHRYSFGSDNRFTIEPFVVFLNLFDERNELTRQTLISATNFTASALTASGCTSCQSQGAVYSTIFQRGGIRQFVQNFLNTRGISAAGLRNDYNIPIAFQDPRYVRFGFRFKF